MLRELGLINTLCINISLPNQQINIKLNIRPQNGLVKALGALPLAGVVVFSRVLCSGLQCCALTTVGGSGGSGGSRGGGLTGLLYDFD